MMLLFTTMLHIYVPNSFPVLSYCTAFDSVEEVTSATTAAVRALFTLKESLLSASPFLDTMKVLSPVWLRSQSHFVRTLASELSLLLQVRLYYVCLCNFYENVCVGSATFHWFCIW